MCRSSDRHSLCYFSLRFLAGTQAQRLLRTQGPILSFAAKADVEVKLLDKQLQQLSEDLSPRRIDVGPAIHLCRLGSFGLLHGADSRRTHCC